MSTKAALPRFRRGDREAVDVWLPGEAREAPPLLRSAAAAALLAAEEPASEADRATAAAATALLERARREGTLALALADDARLSEAPDAHGVVKVDVDGREFADLRPGDEVHIRVRDRKSVV